MQEDQASKTAHGAALQRAAHQLLDKPPVFSDPLALPMLGQEEARALAADPSRFQANPLSPFLRAFMAARSRFAEDELAQGVARGVRQYVLLGAGLDTLAYRGLYPPGLLRVFEVDHPATQAFKRRRLAEAGIALPPDLTFAPVDFHAQTLADGLARAGFDSQAPAVFAWLGVTPYLVPEAVRETLRFIAGMPAGSEVVFDYAVDPTNLSQRTKLALESIMSKAEAGGEPWLAFFDPAALAGELGAMGFAHLEDLGQEEINARYFAGRADGLKVGTLFRLMAARV